MESLSNFDLIRERAGNYSFIYFEWLTEKLGKINPFTLLSIAITCVFILVIYVWFRNRE